MDLVFAIVILPALVCILLAFLVLVLLKRLARQLIKNEETRQAIMPLLYLFVIAAAIFVGYNAIDHGWLAPSLGPWH